MVKGRRMLLMYYPDLTSVKMVEDLPMPEYNLRMHVIQERLELERQPLFEHIMGGDEPEMQKVSTGKPLHLVLAEMRQQKLAEEQSKEGA